MTPERWQQIRAVYEEAAALVLADRAPFLDRVCTGDFELRREVESLFDYEDQAGSVFLRKPAVDLMGAAVAEAPVTSRIGRRFGVYRILEELGHGGMGEVYRGARVDGQYDKQVAIKLVRSGYDSSAILEHFRHERQILASLDHPNIARLLDGGTTEEGTPYLVMELIEGLPIDEYCNQHDLGIAERLQLFLQVCSAVQYAHQRLVVHRDLKPRNILVTTEGVPKLLDFGIAKILDPSAGVETTLVRPMTPEYASPEQIRGEPITTASDVYSLGVVFYRLLTGRSPYRVNAHNPTELARAVLEFDPERPSTALLRPSLSKSLLLRAPGPRVRTERSASQKIQRVLKGDLDNIALKALRKEPDLRYTSVEQLADDIRRHLQGLPIRATQGSWNYRAAKFAKRHKIAILATLMFTLAVLVGVAATIREARIAHESEGRAERRFEDIRQLSDWLLFEVHDSIRDLPGSTPARKLIVQKSLEYLSRLAKDSAQDVPLQRQLANAYERIGLVQGDPEGSNLGDINGALDSFKKALTIRLAIVSSPSKNTADLIALSASYRELCAIHARYLGEIGRALEYCNDAVRVAEELQKAEPQNPAARMELAQVYAATGTVYGQGSTSGNAGDSYAALEDHRKALALIQDLARSHLGDMELSSWQGRLSLLTADDLFETGHVSEAIPLYQQATRTFEDLTRRSSSPSYGSSLDLAYQRMGDMLLVAGRFQESVGYYRKQLDVDTRLVAGDPENMLFRISLAASYATYGHGLWRAGHVAEALTSFRHGFAELAQSKQNDARAKGLETILQRWMAGALDKRGDMEGALQNYRAAEAADRRVCESDPKDVEDCLDLAGTQNCIARIYLRTGKVGEALTEYQNALAVSEPLTRGARPNLEAVYTMVNTYYGMGEVYRMLARRPDSQQRQGQLWNQASEWYGKSRAAVSSITEWRPITPNEFDAQDPAQIDVRWRLCQSKIKKVDASQESSAAATKRRLVQDGEKMPAPLGYGSKEE